MGRIWACLRRAAFLAAALAALSGVLAAPALAQERVSREEGRRLASALLREGQPLAAREIALALITADPNDAVALILLSRAERLLGAPTAALRSGREAWAAADRPDLQFGAAIVRAQALSDMNRDFAAGLWYRQAGQVAETDEARALAASEYGALRDASPLRINLSFGLTPRSNINNGGANEIYALHPDFVQLIRDYLGDPTLDPKGSLTDMERPLSGIEMRAGVHLSYEIARNDRSATHLEMRANLRGYVLSPEARADAPEARGSDFADAQLSFGLSHGWRANGGPTHRLRAEAGHVWYGGDPYSRFLQLSYGQSWRLEDATMSVEGTVRGDWFAGDRPQEAEVGMTLAYSHDLGPGRVTMTGGLRNRQADDPDKGYRSLSMGVGYSWGDTGANSLFLGLEGREYDRTLYIEGTRRDYISTARLSVAVPGIEFYGFQPVVTVEGRNLTSTADRPESRSLGAGLTLLSTF